MRTTGFIVLALGLSGSAVLAQEEGSTPGAIPDPSTYQGSTELQRQSDEQSQQGYQQQFGQPQPSYGGGYQGGGGYGGAGRSSGPSRATLSFHHVARDPALARLAGLIELVPSVSAASRPFASRESRARARSYCCVDGTQNVTAAD